MDTLDDTLDLRSYVEVLRRRWRIVAATALITVAAAASTALLQTPRYEGVAELAIEPVRSGGDAALEDLILGTNIVETERRVITSRPVTTRVIDALELTDVAPAQVVEQVEVTTVANTRVVRIVATDTNPDMAAALANAYASAYLDYRRDRAIDELTAARTNLDERAQSLQAQINQIDAELRTTDGGTLGSLSPDDAALTAQRDSLLQQQALVGAQLAAIDPGGEAIRGGGEILLPADPDDDPVAPRPVRSGVLALVLGLMLGVGLGFLRDHFDDAVRDDGDMQRATNGATIIGRVTRWDRSLADQRLITLVDPHDPISEEFQALAANVRFSLVNVRGGAPATAAKRRLRGQSVLVSSSTPGEGKSSIAGNLAVAAAAAGARVILIGADLRQPTISSRFGITGARGLSDLLVDARRLSSAEAITSHLLASGTPRLQLLPAGTIPPNPTELIASPQMTWLHTQLTQMADLIIYDTPPLLAVADTLELSQHVDACILVARLDHCSRRELQHAMERLVGVGAHVAGLVANGIEQTKRAGYGYGYGYRVHSYRPREDADAPGAAAPSRQGSPAFLQPASPSAATAPPATVPPATVPPAPAIPEADADDSPARASSPDQPPPAAAPDTDAGTGPKVDEGDLDAMVAELERRTSQRSRGDVDWDSELFGGR